MITLKKFNSSKTLEFRNSTEFIEMLKFCNPVVMQFYRVQIESQVAVKVTGIGVGVRIVNT